MDTRGRLSDHCEAQAVGTVMMTVGLGEWLIRYHFGNRLCQISPDTENRQAFYAATIAEPQQIEHSDKYPWQSAAENDSSNMRYLCPGHVYHSHSKNQAHG
jgi:hypothetical protein